MTEHRTSKGRLLVVEDDETNRRMVATYLERSGYEVLTAADGPEGLDLALDEELDLVLLDIMMPGMNGNEVLARIRAKHSPQELPVIMVTARAESEEQVAALRAGANDWVAKPLDLKLLLARVEARLWVDRAPPRPPPDAGPLGPGRVLDGRWRLEKRIGGGGAGTVYRGRHQALDRQVAVKVIAIGAGDEEALEHFRAEGALACRVDHPNAVDVLDFGVSDDGVPYLVMELLSGVDLAKELHLKGQLAPARCLEIVGPVCAALAEAHEIGIVHRDIKPANIFLHRTRRGEVVKVVDFGVAKFTAPGGTGEGRPSEGILGTLSYVAPERLEGRAVDGRADVYSLGMVLYEMLTGAPPFDTLTHDAETVARMQRFSVPRPVRELRSDVSPELADVLARAVAKEPRHRPDARGLAVALATALGGSQP